MSDNKSCSNTQYGGQAVIEGVMMRGKKHYAVACRKSNNEIVVKQENVESFMKGFQWLNKPFLRGTLALIDAMVLGMKTLIFSANLQLKEIDEEERKKKQEQSETIAPEKTEEAKSETINDIRVMGSVVLGLAFGILLFVVGPNILAHLVNKQVANPFLMNIIEGFVKITIFFLYIYLISKMKDIQRIFMYHGAEHKVINTYESGLPLTLENISKYGTIHTRCGTSFIMIVLVISIFVHFFVGWSDIWYWRILARLALLPVIAGIAYEIIKFAGRHQGSKLLRVLLAPGLWMQKITTREPTDDQVEVALTALNTVFQVEQKTTIQ